MIFFKTLDVEIFLYIHDQALRNMEAILEEAGTTMDNGKCQYIVQCVFPMLYDLPLFTISTIHVLVLASLSFPTSL